MKRYILLITAVLMVAVTVIGLTSCAPVPQDDERLTVVCTVFPQYDWVRHIMGNMADSADIVLLADSGTDMHSYQASAADIVKISTCDLLVYVGGTSDEWVTDTLASSGGTRTVSLIDHSDVLKAETVEGMQHDDSEHCEGGAECDDHDHSGDYDEHVWLSLSNAQSVCMAICEELCEIDPDNADLYKSNTESYIEKLKQLDNDFKSAVSSAKRSSIVVADRFPFRYLVHDYDIDYFAAFPGCSAETQAGFETVAFLAEKADELSVPVILVTEGSDKKLAETIIENTSNTDRDILTLNSLQSVTQADVDGGLTYVSAMKENLLILKEALN